MKIALHTTETIYSARHLPSWLMLAGAAGAVNGFAFLACEQFVTHVTGTVTRMGLETNNLKLLAQYSTVFFSFVAGAVAAFVTIKLRAGEGSRDRWAAPLVVVALILAGTATAGNVGTFGPFGGRVAADPPPFIFLSLLAFAAGLQNSAVATSTGMTVRTTHLTGPTTDIGTLLGAALLTSGKERRAALRGAALRAGTVASFLTGAAVAVPLALAFGYLAALGPAAAVLAAAALSFVPHWGHPEAPFRQPGDPEPPSGINPGLPSDARPQAFDEA